ncbi:MAG: response regulator [Chloroflexi bacterium]|nr:response regulator [Chloroflexota bacterium]
MTKILLVDDVYTARSMVERVLRHVGRYEVQAVGSGEEALALVAAEPPDLVVLDVCMNGMDGLKTLRELRAYGVACPVVAYTARTEHIRGEFVAQGFDAYVQKNGNLGSLLTTVRELVGT